MAGLHIVKCHQCKPKLIKSFEDESKADEFIQQHVMGMTFLSDRLKNRHKPVKGFVNERDIRD